MNASNVDSAVLGYYSDHPAAREGFENYLNAGHTVRILAKVDHRTTNESAYCISFQFSFSL